MRNINRDEFIKKVNQQTQSRTYEQELVPVMEELPKYYGNLTSQVNEGKIDDILKHEGNTFEYRVILSEKALEFIRTEDAIEVHSIDLNKNTNEIIDRITTAPARVAYSVKNNEVFTWLTLEGYLPYLLETE